MHFAFNIVFNFAYNYIYRSIKRMMETETKECSLPCKYSITVTNKLGRKEMLEKMKIAPVCFVQSLIILKNTTGLHDTQMALHLKRALPPVWLSEQVTLEPHFFNCIALENNTMDDILPCTTRNIRGGGGSGVDLFQGGGEFHLFDIHPKCQLSVVFEWKVNNANLFFSDNSLFGSFRGGDDDDEVVMVDQKSESSNKKTPCSINRLLALDVPYTGTVSSTPITDTLFQHTIFHHSTIDSRTLKAYLSSSD